MIGNPQPIWKNVQDWNDFVNEVRFRLSQIERSIPSSGGGDVPDASETVKGIMKLYKTLGENADGAVTQRGISLAFNDLKAYLSETYATQPYVSQEIQAALDGAAYAWAVPLTLQASGWNTDNTILYPIYYDVPIRDLAEDDRADVIFPMSSLLVAEYFGISSAVETFAGKIRLRAMAVPDQDMDAVAWGITIRGT